MLLLIAAFFAFNAFILTYIGLSALILSYQKIYRRAKQIAELIKRFKKRLFLKCKIQKEEIGKV